MNSVHVWSLRDMDEEIHFRYIPILADLVYPLQIQHDPLSLTPFVARNMMFQAVQSQLLAVGVQFHFQSF